MSEGGVVARSQLSKAAIEGLRSAGSTCVFSQGEVVVQKGETGTAFYLVVSGEVEIRLQAEDGRALPLSRLGPGATFGEMALLRDEPVSADVVAIDVVTLMACPAEDFKKALAEPTILVVAGVGAMAAGALLYRVLPHFLISSSSGEAESQATPGVAVQVAFALLILGWGPLMAYQKGAFVHKFKMQSTQYLLSYRVTEESLELVMIGAHENYFRDLSKYLKGR